MYMDTDMYVPHICAKYIWILQCVCVYIRMYLNTDIYVAHFIFNALIFVLYMYMCCSYICVL